MVMEGYTETITILYNWKISANKIQHVESLLSVKLHSLFSYSVFETIVSTNMSSNGIETIIFVLNGCKADIFLEEPVCSGLSSHHIQVNQESIPPGASSFSDLQYFWAEKDNRKLCFFVVVLCVWNDRIFTSNFMWLLSQSCKNL